jgi:hypothetical protein
MIEVEITGRETMILFPGQIFGVPDNIAGQLIRRGKAKEIKPDILAQEPLPDRVEKPKKKSSK